MQVPAELPTGTMCALEKLKLGAMLQACVPPADEQDYLRLRNAIIAQWRGDMSRYLSFRFVRQVGNNIRKRKKMVA